jgi:hypothetical protein
MAFRTLGVHGVAESRRTCSERRDAKQKSRRSVRENSLIFDRAQDSAGAPQTPAGIRLALLFGLFCPNCNNGPFNIKLGQHADNLLQFVDETWE